MLCIALPGSLLSRECTAVLLGMRREERFDGLGMPRQGMPSRAQTDGSRRPARSIGCFPHGQKVGVGGEEFGVRLGEASGGQGGLEEFLARRGARGLLDGLEQ